MNFKKEQLLSLFVIFIFSIIGMKALVHVGLFSAHDIWHQVARLYYYKTAFLENNFPPYIIENLGNNFGYPLFLFSYHLPWLISLPLLALNVQIPEVIKILFWASFFLSGVSMYFLSKEIFKNRLGALASGILYLWAPYRFLTILVSAAMGTAWFFVFLPLFLLGLYKKSPLLIAIGFSAMVLSHLGTLPSILPLTLIFTFGLLIKEKNKKNFLKKILIGLFGGFVLSSWYLIPALYYSHNVWGFGDLYKNYFLNFSQLVYSKWGFGIIEGSAKQGAISFQLGIAQWLALVFSILIFIKKPKNKNIYILLLISLLVSILAMLDISRPLWEFANKFVSLDFPTRFMLPSVFILSLISGFVITEIPKKFQLILSLILIIVALVTNRNHLGVNMYTNYPISTYINSETTTTSFHEYFPKEVNRDVLGEINDVFTNDKNVKVKNFKSNTKETSTDIEVSKNQKITLNKFIIPGTVVFIDNQKINFEKNIDGKIIINTKEGLHNIKITFEDTNIIKSANLISLFGTIIFIIILLGFRKNSSSKPSKKHNQV